VHSKQKHSADLLFFEFLKIVMWFNPLLYFYQQRIAVIHEYIADDFATKIHQKEQYINSLLSEVFAVENISFINQFYKQSFIKKRIIMMKKEKSKHAKQLKYLLLIPVLVSMLFYTSCSENRMETIDNNVEESIMINQNGKEFQFVYLDMGKGVIKSISNKKTYLDLYVGQEKLEGEEVTYDDLNKLERDEFDTMYSRLKKMEAKGVKFYLNERKRKTVAVDFDFSKIRNRNYEERNGINNFTITEEITEEIPFSIIEKTPTFPGCESGDKNCFHKMIQNHFTKNFDSGLPKTLSLTTGMKKIYVGFKIDEKGNVIDIQARTPHEKITEEVIRVMELLPKMMPGEQRGTKITVKYSIPFTITVE
jgi:bla regulator protein BlaR1